jgi:hypothetical protein
MGAARRGGGDDDRGREAIWKKTAKCWSGRRRGLYRTPNLLSRVVLPTVTKGPLVSGCNPFCHGWPHDPWQKGHFARDALKANFRPLVPGGVTTRDKREAFSLGW